MDADEFLLREYEHAWEHTRHTEGQRAQYLGFFLTFLATAVVLGTPHYLDGLDDPDVAVQVSVALAAASLVTWFVSTSVKRWGQVIRHYDGVLFQTRKRILSDDQLNLIWIRRLPGVGVQYAAEVALLMAHVALIACAVLLLVKAINVGAPVGYLPATGAVVTTVTACLLGVDRNLPRRMLETKRR